ncbi:MAG: hypothetical protein ACREF1_11145, partial [Acetobacteraceae bacterium]
MKDIPSAREQIGRLIETGDTAAAEQALRALCESDPKDLASLARLVVLLATAGRKPEASELAVSRA